MVKTHSSIKKVKKTFKSISNRGNELIKFGYSEKKTSSERFKKLVSFSYEKGIQNTIGALMDLINKNFRNPTFVKKLIKDIDNLRKWIMKYNIRGGGPNKKLNMTSNSKSQVLNITSNSKSQVLKQLKEMLEKLKNVTSIEKLKKSMPKMPTLKNTTNKLKGTLLKSIPTKNKSSQNNKSSKKHKKKQSCNNCMKEKCSNCSKTTNKIANTIRHGINSVTDTNTNN